MGKSKIVISQGKKGYRFSTEPFFIANYVQLKPYMRVLDIGTGCGVIPILLTIREPLLDITALEIQKSLYRNAVQNVCANGLKEKIQVYHGDFLNLAKKFKKFDLIISNPPFRKINSGRLNSNMVKAIARHELTLSLSKLIGNSAPLLKRKGKLVLTYHPDRLKETMNELHINQLFPRRFRIIHSYSSSKPKIFLVEAVKNEFTQTVTEKPFYIYNNKGSYTPEMKKIYASFNYPCRSHRLREKRSSVCAR